MNHDMMHCYGCSTTIEGNKLVANSTEPCPVRDKCQRYKASIEAVELRLEYVAYRVGSVEECGDRQMLINKIQNNEI